MRNSLKNMKRNERVMIIIDVLLRSRASFMNVFLMAFMMNASLNNSPLEFIQYSITRHVIVALASLFLLPSFKNHPLPMWRLSSVFSILEVLTIILLGNRPGSSFILAIFSGCETACYWRPKMYFDATEVSDDRRLKFKSTSQIWIEATKILMPVVLGFVIDGSSYQKAAIFILAISVTQFICTLFFHPATKLKKGPVHIVRVAKEVFARESLRRLLVIQGIRGVITASGLYIVVATICLNSTVTSGAERGVATAVGSLLAIVILAAFRRVAHSMRLQKLILIGLTPSVILMPLLVLMFPGDKVIGGAFFVVASAVAASLFNCTLGLARISDILSRHVHNEEDRMAVEVISELALSTSCVFSLVVLLVITINFGYTGQVLSAFVVSFLIIPLLRTCLPSAAWRKNGCSRRGLCDQQGGSEENI